MRKRLLDDLKLMDIHIRALFTHDAESRLLFVNEPDGVGVVAPRFFLGRTRAGNIWRFRSDVPATVIHDLNSLCADEPTVKSAFDLPPRHLEDFVQLLEASSSVISGPAYCFTETIVPPRHTAVLTNSDQEKLRGRFEELIAELPNWQPFVAIIENDRAVSVCRSVRIKSEAHEAGVETLSEFRGKGYGHDVTAAWARRVSEIGAIPLYSTSWENSASQAVARKLALKCYGSDFQIQ